MTDAKKVLGIIAAFVIVLAIAGVVIVLAVGGFKLRSVTGSPCDSAPLLINDTQITSIDALQTATGHTFTTAEIDNLGIESCEGGLCTTACPVVTS